MDSIYDNIELLDNFEQLSNLSNLTSYDKVIMRQKKEKNNIQKIFNNDWVMCHYTNAKITNYGEYLPCYDAKKIMNWANIMTNNSISEKEERRALKKQRRLERLKK